MPRLERTADQYSACKQRSRHTQVDIEKGGGGRGGGVCWGAGWGVGGGGGGGGGGVGVVCGCVVAAAWRSGGSARAWRGGECWEEVSCGDCD